MNDDAVEAHKETTRGIPLGVAHRAFAGGVFVSTPLCLKHDPNYRTYEAGPFASGPCHVCGVVTSRMLTVRR